MSKKHPVVFYDDDEEEYGWPPRREATQATPSVHPDDMPTTTGPDRVAQAIARDRGGWAPQSRVMFAREDPTR